MEIVLLERVTNNLPQGFQPYDIYQIIVENQEVGRLIYRHGNDIECYYDGHVGYHIDEEYRGHHYAYQACLLLKELVDKDYLIITCDPNNNPSRKTIEKLGCEYIETKIIPKHLRKFFSKNEKEKNIYKWVINREDKI